MRKALWRLQVALPHGCCAAATAHKCSHCTHVRLAVVRCAAHAAVHGTRYLRYTLAAATSCGTH
jgi:hypothetical protein